MILFWKSQRIDGLPGNGASKILSIEAKDGVNTTFRNFERWKLNVATPNGGPILAKTGWYDHSIDPGIEVHHHNPTLQKRPQLPFYAGSLCPPRLLPFLTNKLPKHIQNCAATAVHLLRLCRGFRILGLFWGEKVFYRYEDLSALPNRD